MAAETASNDTTQMGVAEAVMELADVVRVLAAAVDMDAGWSGLRDVIEVRCHRVIVDMQRQLQDA